jgi:hypothetical protein
MKRARGWILVGTVLLAVTGCGDDGTTSGGGTGGIGGIGGGGGTGALLGTTALDPLVGTPRYAVVSSDFTSSSIAMLDEGFNPLDESWINSGTTYPGLVATLSGDVALPSEQAGNGTFTIIDRFFTDVITRFFVPSGNLLGQVRTQGGAETTGFSSNPQDVVFVSAESAWVTRYEPNLDPSAPPRDRGNDLVELNPTEMSLTGARIDLSSLNTRVQVVREGSTVDVEIFARPSRAVRIGSRILVGLDRLSAGFDAAGSGMVAVVDLEDESLRAVELEGMKNCGNVAVVPGAPTKVVVSCAGFSQPFQDEAQIRASSGIAVLDASAVEVDIERVWRLADYPEAAVTVSGVVPLDEEHVWGVANGDFDSLQMIDLATGQQQAVYEATGSFVIGRAAYDSARQMLFVPDAAANAVVELAFDGGQLIQLGSVEIARELGLPPTQVYLLE